MSLYIGTTNVLGVGGVYPLPSGDSYSRGGTLITDGTYAYWSYPGYPGGNPSSGWRYRSIITHGFSAAGYKGSNPWRALNKTWVTTDITYYCGEQLTNTADYIDGFFSDYNGYVLGANNGMGGTTNHTESYNLYTGIGRVRGGGTYSPFTFGWNYDNPGAYGMNYGTVGGWDMGNSRRAFGGTSAATYQYGYATGGGPGSTEKMHFPTEVMYQTTGNNRGGGNCSGAGGQEVSWWAIGGGSSGLYHANDSWFGSPTQFTTDGYNKFLSSKYGYHYVGTQNNTTTPRIWFNDTTGSFIGNIAQTGGYGEDVNLMGQDWGYVTGTYDGNQNNICDKTNYSNNTMSRMGAATRNKGHYGASSGSASSAAATIAASARPGV